MMWRAWDEPPSIDHRPSLNAWRIEESLLEFIDAYDRYDWAVKQEGAAATVQIVTGLDRAASRQTLLDLQERQSEILGEVFGPLIYQAKEAYAAELMRLGSMAGVNA